MHAQATDSVDQWVLRAVDHHRNPAFTWFARHLMQAGTSLPVLGLCALTGLLAVAVFRWWRPGIAVASAFLAAGLVAEALKPVIGRARPPLELSLVDVGGYAMPSADAAVTSAAACALFVAFRWASRDVKRLAATVLTLAVVVIGACLVYLGAHWPSDVLAGWALGTATGATTGILCRSRAPGSADLRPGGRSA